MLERYAEVAAEMRAGGAYAHSTLMLSTGQPSALAICTSPSKQRSKSIRARLT